MPALFCVLVCTFLFCLPLRAYASPALSTDGSTVKPGTYSVTANLSLAASDASTAGFPVLAGLAGPNGSAYMTNPANPIGLGGVSGLPTTPVENNATLVVATDGTLRLTVPIENPVFTLQKLGKNAQLSHMSYKTVKGDFGNYTSRISSITLQLPRVADASYSLSGCGFHPTILKESYDVITAPMSLTVDGFSALPRAGDTQGGSTSSSSEGGTASSGSKDNTGGSSSAQGSGGRVETPSQPGTAGSSTKKLSPGTYTVTANISLGAADASKAGFPILSGIAGDKARAYMTNATNPLGLEGGSEGVPTSPVKDNATLVVSKDGTATLTVPVTNPVFTMQKLGSNAKLLKSKVTTKKGSYGNYPSRISMIRFTLRDTTTKSYVLKKSSFHPTILADQYPKAITVPLLLELDFASAKKASVSNIKTGNHGTQSSGTGVSSDTKPSAGAQSALANALASQGASQPSGGTSGTSGQSTQAQSGTVETAADGSLKAGTYTVSANIWVNKETSGLPLQPHFTNAAFPPMNPVSGNATLKVDSAGNARLTIPIVIQNRVMYVRALRNLPIVDSSSANGGLTSVTLDLGKLSSNDQVITRSCVAEVYLGDLASTIIGGERSRTWDATFQMNFSGAPASGGGEVPAAVQEMLEEAGSDGVAADSEQRASNAAAAALDALDNKDENAKNTNDKGSASASSKFPSRGSSKVGSSSSGGSGAAVGDDAPMGKDGASWDGEAVAEGDVPEETSVFPWLAVGAFAVLALLFAVVLYWRKRSVEKLGTFGE